MAPNYIPPKNSDYSIKRLMSLLAVGAVLMAAPQPVSPENLKRLSLAAFNEYERIIADLEGGDQTAAVIGEMAVAKRLVIHGKLLLRAGRTKKAEILADQLQLQIELIRMLIAASEALRELSRSEQEILEMEQNLKRLKERLNRLSLEVGGAQATGAFPGESPKR
jgi:hypothetical protein